MALVSLSRYKISFPAQYGKTHKRHNNQKYFLTNPNLKMLLKYVITRKIKTGVFKLKQLESARIKICFLHKKY